MKNEELIDTYITHTTHCKPQGNETLSVNNGIIYSYTTPIAILLRPYMYINTAKYSATTARQVNMIRDMASNRGIISTSIDSHQMRHLLTSGNYINSKVEF